MTLLLPGDLEDKERVLLQIMTTSGCSCCGTKEIRELGIVDTNFPTKKKKHSFLWNYRSYLARKPLDTKPLSLYCWTCYDKYYGPKGWDNAALERLGA